MLGAWNLLAFMLILGIDPGVASTGWAIINYQNLKISGCQDVNYGVIKTKTGLPMAERLAIIYQKLSEIIKEFKPEICAIEEIYFGKNAKTAMMVGQARGVVILTAVNAGLLIYEFTPLQVKIAITGYGRAEKMQMQKMVQKMLGLSELPKPDDAADALAVAICCAATNNLKTEISKLKIKFKVKKQMAKLLNC